MGAFARSKASGIQSGLTGHSHDPRGCRDVTPRRVCCILELYLTPFVAFVKYRITLFPSQYWPSHGAAQPILYIRTVGLSEIQSRYKHSSAS